jgi:hypothetical protein
LYIVKGWKITEFLKEHHSYTKGKITTEMIKISSDESSVRKCVAAGKKF